MIVDNLLAIGTLVFLEAVLCGDNAVVLAVLAKPLPEHLRRKALFYGLGGALAMRAVAILVAKWLIGPWWVQGVAALLLGYLSVGHLITAASTRGGLAARFSGRTFWGRVAMIELADFAFAMQGLGSASIALYGAPELKRRYLPPVCAGTHIAAFALSEPEGGSDVAALRMSMPAKPLS